VVERGIERGRDDAGLTYWSDDDSIRPGDRVRVPLGKSDTPTGGIVIEVGGPDLAEGFDLTRIKGILGRTRSHLTADLVELARWISDYYVCPLGMVFAAILPAAVKRGVGTRREILLERVADAAAPPELPPSVRAAWDAVSALDPAAFPLRPRDLADRLGHRTLRLVNALTRRGLLVPGEAETVASRRPILGIARARTPSGITPTPEQSAVIEGVSASPASFAVHLLRGITGSGKTEVYMGAIERVLAGPGDPAAAIVLVPEIALTPQAVARFSARFAEAGVAVLHSGLTAAQRHREWSRAASGEARVVVGARSAVFAPVPRLGLIVVDEEHDGSYKQDQLPRYHARDVAIKRAQIVGCPVLLGSATPSLESWSNARSGRYRLWELHKRVGGGRLPQVRIVDLARDLGSENGGPSPPSVGAIGPTLEQALRRCLDAGAQAILLLNQRGHARFIHCIDRRCGWVLVCRSCDAAMVFHKDPRLPRGGLVKCHHCRAEQLLPTLCPACSGPVRSAGLGTQRVEEELEERFGSSHGLKRNSTLLRLDSDAVERVEDYHRALDQFGRGLARVLLGTQMVAKGLDFPGVRLVGVINADVGLSMPDFRSGERTFQLISQVAGRAGRGSAPGLVIVQTLSPNDPSIRLAAEHDYRGFAERELSLRVGANLPPAWRMARIVCRHRDADRAAADAARIADALRPFRGPDFRVEGPMPCVFERLHDHWRHAVEVYAARAGDLRAALGQVRRRGLLRSDFHTAVDVDPVFLL
jgi:primosomal protein N' (replication factor Y)